MRQLPFTEFLVPFAEFNRPGAVTRGEVPIMRAIRLIELEPTKTQIEVEKLLGTNRVCYFEGVVYFTTARRDTPLDSVVIFASRVSYNSRKLESWEDIEPGQLPRFKLTDTTSFRIAQVLFLFGIVSSTRAKMHAKHASNVAVAEREIEMRTQQEIDFIRLLSELDPKTVRRLQRNFNKAAKTLKTETKPKSDYAEHAKTKVEVVAPQ